MSFCEGAEGGLSDTRCGWPWLTTFGERGSWWIIRIESACASCVFQHGSVQLDEVFCLLLVSVTGEIVQKQKSKIHVMLRLFPNLSNGLEGMCIFQNKRYSRTDGNLTP